MGSKRGAAVLEAPEEESTYAADRPHRGVKSARVKSDYSATDEEFGMADDLYDEPAFRRQRGAQRVRIRKGLPASWKGRIALALGFFAVLGVIAAGLAGLESALLHSSRFVLPGSENIEITGNRNVTRAQVLSVFAADLERNVFRIPLGERRADLERLPWVQHATVMRLLPDRIRVAITERTPVAFVRQGSQIGMVDATGVLLDMPRDAAIDPHYSFPVLTGLSQRDPLSTRAARMAIYEQFLQALGAKNSASISEVDVSNPEDLKAVVSGGGSDILVHFGDEDFLQRYQEFEQHLPEWRQQYPKLAAADMRYERQVVLEMQPGAGVPVSGGSGSTESASAAVGPAAQTSAVTAPAGVRAKTPEHGTLRPARTSAARSGRRPEGFAGKERVGNGRIFADLAAARRARLARARQVRTKQATAAGAESQ